MEDIKFNNERDIDGFFRHLKVLGSGAEGVVHKKGIYAYKRYNDLYRDLYSNDISIYRLSRYRDVIIDNIYFIRALIYYNDMVVGSVSNFSGGISCSKLRLYMCRLDKLVRALSILKKNVYELSELGICMEDIFLGNILYLDGTFRFIDTGSYYDYIDIPGVDRNDVDLVYRKNMRKVINKLFLCITDYRGEEDNFIYRFLLDTDSIYKDYMCDIDLMIDPDNTILGIKRELEEYIGYEIESFSSSRKELIKLKK